MRQKMPMTRQLPQEQSQEEIIQTFPLKKRNWIRQQPGLKPQTLHSTPATSYEAVQTAADIGSLGDMVVDEIPGSGSKRIYFARRCSFKYFLDNCSSFIKNCAGGNLTIDCSDLMWFSFNKKTLAALKDNPNLSLTIIFTYNGRKYTFTIPAGYDLDLLQDSNGWYGFMYLKMMFGGEEII